MDPPRRSTPSTLISRALYETLAAYPTAVREAVARGSLASEVEASVRERLRDRRKGLLTERKKLPGQIAALSAEGKRLLDTMADVNGVARRLAEERLQGLGDEMGRCEARLATVERELATCGGAMGIDGGLWSVKPEPFCLFLGKAEVF